MNVAHYRLSCCFLWFTQDVSDFPVEKIVYVMTDFTESNFKFWAEHPVRQNIEEKKNRVPAIYVLCGSGCPQFYASSDFCSVLSGL